MPPVPQPGSGLLCRTRAGAGGFEESAQTRTCGRARTSAAENCAVAPRSSVLRNEDRRHLTETDEQGAARMLFVLALSLSPSLCATSSGVRGRTCHQHRAFAWPTLWIFATTLHSVLTSHARTAEKPVYQLHNSHNDRRSVAKPRTSKTLFMRAPRCTAPVRMRVGVQVCETAAARLARVHAVSQRTERCRTREPEDECCFRQMHTQRSCQLSFLWPK